MQPFDGGNFDKRYEAVFAPAIEAAGIEPYRVDRDPSVNIPIQDIEKGIRDSALCLADITTDNPNVWFELGYAFAIPREVVLVCSDERNTKYPFDVQHRNIIKYCTGAPQYYEDLRHKITERIKALLKKKVELGTAISHSVVKNTEGLNQHEIVALTCVAQNSFLTNGFVYGSQIQSDMDNAGFTDIATAIALKTLTAKGLLEVELRNDGQYDAEDYAVYKTSERGDQWLVENQDKLTLKKELPQQTTDNDIPF